MKKSLVQLPFFGRLSGYPICITNFHSIHNKTKKYIKITYTYRAFSRCRSLDRFLYSTILLAIGSSKGLYFVHKVEINVAKICPTSAITESVNGIPTMAYKIQKTLPAVVTGAMLP